jgi:hypothetical protein
MSETSGSTEDGSSFSSLYESLRRVTRLPGVSLLMSTLSEMSTTRHVSRDVGCHFQDEALPYFPSGCTLTRTFFVPMTFTTSPT